MGEKLMQFVDRDEEKICISSTAIQHFINRILISLRDLLTLNVQLLKNPT